MIETFLVKLKPTSQWWIKCASDFIWDIFHDVSWYLSIGYSHDSHYTHLRIIWSRSIKTASIESLKYVGSKVPSIFYSPSGPGLFLAEMSLSLDKASSRNQQTTIFTKKKLHLGAHFLENIFRQSSYNLR